MENDIYEVTRDEYVGFLSQIKKECLRVEKEDHDNFHFIKSYSKKFNTHLCTRIVPIENENENEQEHFYVFNMPQDEERQPPTPVRKILLETQEEVQAFFDILSKVSKGEKK